LSVEGDRRATTTLGELDGAAALAELSTGRVERNGLVEDDLTGFDGDGGVGWDKDVRASGGVLGGLDEAGSRANGDVRGALTGRGGIRVRS
jgi:hypothetical protein